MPERAPCSKMRRQFKRAMVAMTFGFDSTGTLPVKRRVGRDGHSPGPGKNEAVAVSRIDRLLALTDPFDLSQAVERYVRSLPADRVRGLLSDAGPRLGSSYRSEFLRLLGRERDDFPSAVSQSDDTALRETLARFLKSNLRAIPIFGSPFGLAVLEHAPVERAVGIGEEAPDRGMRAAMIAGIALLLILLGAAGERLVVARSAPPSPEPVAAVTVPSPQATRAPQHARATPPLYRTAARAVPAPTEPPLVQQQQQQQAQAPVAYPVAAQPPALPASPRAASPTMQPAHGKGVAVVVPPQATPAPQQSELDTTDMPQSYTDATPIPEPTSEATAVPVGYVRVATPKPSPKHHGWLHRAIMHLDPFKPHPNATP